MSDIQTPDGLHSAEGSIDTGSAKSTTEINVAPTDVNQAVAFLENMHPNGPWVLTSIIPGGRVTTSTFFAEETSAMKDWIELRTGLENLYWQVNWSGDKRLHKKAKKEDIVEGRFLHVDVDPITNPVESLADQREKILTKLKAFKPSPSSISDSGNGYQAFWRLEKPCSPEEVEPHNKWIAEQCGGDFCHNLDRIMRLPGTINIPNKKKRDEGRIEVSTGIVWQSDATYRLDEFGRVEEEEEEKKPSKISFKRLNADEINALPKEVGVIAVRMTNALGEPYEDRSDGVFAMCCAAVRAGLPKKKIVALLLDPELAVSGHVLDQKSPKQYAIRQAERAAAAVAAEAGQWQTDDKGRRLGNLHNMRIALAELGLKVWWDEHADQTWCGEDLLTDRIERELRLVKFVGLRLKYNQSNSDDMLSQIAYENRRHPLREKLLNLQWDGKPRIESFFVDYAKADDTDYTRTVTRLWFLAGAQRVLYPGCKFDQLVILESAQGGNKSSALEKLAFGPKWFTDNLPLNGDSKIAIEQTQGKWICEVADMQGKSGDDNKLKAFLSRNHDRARLAYGRRSEDHAREWIAIGTTNDHAYLKDSTGNRRFWPIRVGVIDLGFDPEQLWAEAVARRGESIRMPSNLWELAAEQQDLRRNMDPWLETIANRIKHEDSCIRMEDIWFTLGIEVAKRDTRGRQRIGKIMAELGYTYKQKKQNGDRSGCYEKGRGTNADLLLPDEPPF